MTQTIYRKRAMCWLWLGLALILGLAPRAAGAQTAPRTFYVAQLATNASDANPGSATQPWQTIGRAVREVQPGDTVIVREGTYQEAIQPTIGGTGALSRITFKAEVPGKVVVTGADPLTGATAEGLLWRYPWTVPLCAYSDEFVMRRELVVVDGKVMRAVATKAEVVPGTFFVDGTDCAPTAIYLRLPGDVAPAGHKVEAARRTYLFKPVDPQRRSNDCGLPGTPGFFHVSGFIFRHAANRAQWGALCPGSEGSVIDNNTVEWTNGKGIEGNGRNHLFRGNHTNDNGQSGIGGKCNSCIFEYNHSLRNNWKGYNPMWEAGGGKWSNSTNTIIRYHEAGNNRGPGIWLDIDNTDNTVEGSIAYGNDMAGIMLEYKTTGTIVRNNVLYDNRTYGGLGAGLLIQSAGGNTIVHNSFIANKGRGLWVRANDIGKGLDGNNKIYNNLFINNTDGTRGYEIAIEGNSSATQTALANAQSNKLDGNLYWHPNSAYSNNIFYFSPDTTRPDNFRGDDIVRWRQLTLGDANARIVDPLIEDGTRRTGWRITANSPARSMGVTPPVAVPVDRDHQARPGVKADVGADQYVAPANVALKKPATASITQSGSNPAYAVDGIVDNNRWIPGAVNTARWLEVDLQASRVLGSARVFTGYLNGTVDSRAIKNFDLRYWTGTQWATIPGGSWRNGADAQTLVTLTFSQQVSTSKIRFYCLDVYTDNCRLKELEIYGR